MADYIDRDKVTELIDYHQEEYCEAESYFGLLKEDFQQLPSADVAPVAHEEWKHIKWVKDDEDQGGGYWISRCSNCIIPYHSETPYCPHCGAKMDLLN